MFRVDPETGRRAAWVDIQPQDPAGIMNLDLRMLVVTPDGRGYGYTWHRAVSDLYLVKGLSEPPGPSGRESSGVKISYQ